MNKIKQEGLMKTTASEKRSDLKSCMILDSCIAKEGGMAVSAVWRLVHPLAAYPSEPRSRPQHTGETPVPLSKNLNLVFFHENAKTRPAHPERRTANHPTRHHFSSIILFSVH